MMVDRLKHIIQTKINADQKIILEGYCNSIENYRSMTEVRNALLWVMAEIDDIENGVEDDEDPADTPSVDDI